jgi:hypothetical protein
MKTRWAITRKFTRDEDGKLDREEVIAIANREPGSGQPELPGLADSDHAHKYSAIKVSPLVEIGMIRGGTVDASDGFGWEYASQRVKPAPDDKSRHQLERHTLERNRRAKEG